METQRWSLIQAIFHGALERHGAARALYIQTSSGGDASVQREVEELLAADVASARDVTDVVGGAVKDAGQARLNAAIGRRVGVWRIIGPLGEGGMGTVHLAERDDGAFRTRAALKLLNPWLLGGDYEARFERERQLLADLRHPSIANLIDGGVGDDGVPYLVLEYVEGKPITAHADAQGLDLTQRLQLFHKVCLAVQHAHQNLVVHRDLKPGNILVNSEGEPKLLDFGIAKLIDAKTGTAGDQTAAAGTMLLTPAYASPEQLRGEQVTTASDVYALGVVFYELLVGERPPSPNPSEKTAPPVTRPSTALMKRTATPHAVPAPSERGRWARVLRGDLDTIALKALSFEAGRRYATAQQLADDVQRFLTHQPVLARPDSFGYRVAKLAERNPISMALGVTAVVLLALGAVSLAVLAATLRDERDRATSAQLRAEQSARTAERTSAFLASLFRSQDPRNRGGGLTARELLVQGSQRLDEELKGEPTTLAYLANEIGIIQRQLGMLEEAEKNQRRALAIRREIFGPQSRETAAVLSELADVLRTQARMKESEAMQRESLAIREKLDPPDPMALSQSLNNLALVMKEDGRGRESIPIYKRAMEVRLAAFGPMHPQTLVTMSNLGMAERDIGDFAAARVTLQTALDRRLALFGEEHFSTANSLHNLGRLEELEGRFVEAEALYRRAVAAYAATGGPEHNNTAGAMADLAIALEGLGRLAEAEATIREARRIDALTLAPDHPTLVMDDVTLARIEGRLGRLAQAERSLRESLRVLRTTLDADHPRVATAQFELGKILLARGELREARALLAQAVAIRQMRLEARHPAVPAALLALARVEAAAGDAAAAQRHVAEAESAILALPQGHPLRAELAAAGAH